MLDSFRHSAERAANRFRLGYLEPLQFAARKRRRLALFGLERVEEVPGGEMDWMRSAPYCTPDCHLWLAVERHYFTKYLFASDARAVRWRGIPCVIDLNLHPDFASYVAGLRRRSKGANLRQIRRARDAGFFCRTIFRDFYARQLFEIDTSRWFRSGPVPAAVFRAPPSSEFGGRITAAQIAAYLGLAIGEIVPGMRLPEPPPPPCPHHWSIDWGVFIGDDDAAATGRAAPRERLVGYLWLRRTGRLVRTAGIMGHGDYLKRGVMKLLLYDVLEWLLARQDPRVLGLRFLQYGAIEHGNAGLLAWKQRFGFVPIRYDHPP